MIIFGSRGYVRLLAMLTFVCSRCHTPAAHRVEQVTRKFTLFFIPLFPISIRRQMTCTYCGTTSKLSKDDVERLFANQQQPAAPAATPELGAPPAV